MISLLNFEEINHLSVNFIKKKEARKLDITLRAKTIIIIVCKLI